MEITKLKVLLEQKHVKVVEVYSKEDLQKEQDSYLLENNSILGINLKNVDSSDFINEIFEISTLCYLFLENVNINMNDNIFYKCENLQTLTLSGNGLKELPKEIIELKNLQSLDLSSNALKELPKEIVELKNLQSLDLSSNALKELPKEIFELKNLQSLDLSWNGLKELPKEIFELKNLQSLDLSWNGLKELPKEIIELKNLQSLTLSGNELIELPKEIVELRNLQSLDLSENELKELPKEIVELKNLQSLTLSGNRLKELSKEIIELRNLQSLTFSGNELIELPKEIIELKNLQSLTLSWNELIEFPKEIFELKNLQSLDLSGNRLKELPKEIFELKNLQSLDLTGNGLKELPKEIFELKNLQSLTLSGNRLKEFPKEIVELKNLQSLNLSWNGLKEFPKEIIELKNLQSLILRMNELKEFSKEIVELRNLQTLDLSGNGLKEFPKEIVELKNLQSLDLSENELKEFPKEIVELRNLQSLILRMNELKEFPKEIVELKKLQTLDLSENALIELPKEIVKLKNLQSLTLSGNGLTELPKELFELFRLSRLILQDIFNENNKNKIKTLPDAFINLTVLSYFVLEKEYLSSFYKAAYESGLENLKNTIKQKVEQGTSKLYEAKLLFVGEPGAGKTSLMEKIINKNYILKDKTNEVSTLGIDIKKYNFEIQGIDFRTNMWDFGGQQIQYMSHQFFLTPNSLYVLVGDDRKQHTDFDYWFHIINLLSDNSPILVILNEINHKSITNFDLKAYKERFDTHEINLESIDLSKIDARYIIVKQKIESMLFNLPHIGDELPVKWVDIREDLNKIAEDDYFISYNDFKEMCTKHGLENDRYIKTLSNHFHNIGIFLHYSEDTNGLSETIFLHPKWVMDGIYSVLADKTVDENNGKFTKKWLFSFWSEHKNKYSDDIKNKLLTLMLKDKFEICYKLDNEDTYISPQLLPAVLNYDLNWDYRNNLFYRFQYPFMPKGIVSRLIVRLNHLIAKENDVELVWKKGVVLKYHDSEALVIEKETKEGLKVIDISLNGEKFESQNLLSKIKNEIENIHRVSFPNLNFEEMIPCVCSRCIKENPHYFSFETLKNYITNNKVDITCAKSVKDIPISKLLGNVMVNNDESKEAELLKYIEKKGINLNIVNNNTSNSSTNINDSMNQTQTIEINISQTLNQVVSELSSLKRKVQEEDKEEISEIINDFKELGENPSKEEIRDSGLLCDLKDKISEFDEAMQETNVVLNKTSKAIKSAKALGRTYNDLASLCGLPNIPFFIVKE